MTDKLVERLRYYGEPKRRFENSHTPIKQAMREAADALESLTLPQTDLEQRAREMLAAEYEREEMPWSADLIRAGQQETLALGMDAAIRAITKALASSSVPEQDSRMVGALEKFERVIRLADTLASDVPITSAARQHITNAYAALADMLALASSSVPEAQVCEICETPDDCRGGMAPCHLSGEFHSPVPPEIANKLLTSSVPEQDSWQPEAAAAKDGGQ